MRSPVAQQVAALSSFLALVLLPVFLEVFEADQAVIFLIE